MSLSGTLVDILRAQLTFRVPLAAPYSRRVNAEWQGFLRSKAMSFDGSEESCCFKPRNTKSCAAAYTTVGCPADNYRTYFIHSTVVLLSGIFLPRAQTQDEFCSEITQPQT